MAGISRPRGTDDLLPARLAALERAVAVGMEMAGKYGYQRLETPIFEATELFVRGVGDTTDVVNREMYTFNDRGGRSLTLRPEGTAPTVRAFWESELRQAPLPVRLSYAGPMFRYDRPGRGRYRQFNQFGVEVLGDTEPELDAEVIALAWRWLDALGIEGTSLQLNSIGDRECRPRYREALLEHFEPHLAQLPELDQVRLRRNPLRILDSKELGSEELLASAPHTTDFLCSGCREAFERVLLGLDAHQVPFALNPRLVRGLDYYVRTTFEVWHEDLHGAQNSLFGGGRYDGLSELVGYPPAPGVGFAAGLERVVMLAPDGPRLRPPAVFVLAAKAAATSLVIELSESLRGAGHGVVCDAGRRSLKAKMRGAERSGAELVVILGESEVAAGTATVRRLGDGYQAEVPQAELERQLQTLAPSWN